MIQQQDEILIKKLVTKYVGYWPFFLISLICFLLATYFILQIIPPKYEATATIVIKDEKKGSDDSKLMESLNMINTKKIIENEMKVLKSRKIMDSVVKKLRLYMPVYMEGKIRNYNAYTLSPIVVEHYQPENIIETPKVSFLYNYLDSSLLLENNKKIPINQWVSTKYGIIRCSLNDNWDHVKYKNNFYFKLNKLKNTSNDLVNKIDITTSNKLSSVIDLAYRDESPKRAENILNTIVEYYDISSINDKKKLALNTLNFITNRLNSVSGDLDSIEYTVEKYKVRSNASDVDVQNQLYLQNLSSNDQELSKINMQLTVLEEVYRAVNNENMHSDAMMPAIIGITDINLTKLLTELNNKELEYESLKKTVAENNPLLISIKDQINKLKPSVLNNLISQKNNLQAVKKNLSATNSMYSGIIKTLPNKQRQLIELSRDENIKKNIYEFLLQKREESELSYAATLSDNSIINDALSSKYPVSPNKYIAYISAILGSIIFSVFVLYTRVSFSSKILNRSEIEFYTTVPIIGEITYKKNNELKIISSNDRSYLAEEFRRIRTSISFLNNEAISKRILITSNIPGEGKSFVATNLAISHAMTGKKVLLIDMDLHKSGLEQIFNHTEKTPGVTEYLKGTTSINDIIHKVEWQDNLYFIGAGVGDHNASELMLNNNLKKLFSEIDGLFDLVFIDTAPALLITDAIILSQLCHLTVFVIRHQFTPKNIIKTIERDFKTNQIKNPVIIYNGVKKSITNNHYNYGYNYLNIKSQKIKRLDMS